MTDALRELVALAEWDPAEADAAELHGADPVLPTRWRIGEAAGAAFAATGLAAALLWRQRCGSKQRVAVALDAAVAALRSTRYMRIDGAPRALWDPVSGFYPVRDGWVFIHANFPHHRECALAVLGAAERASAEQASRAWSGEALETAIHAAGGCAAFARSGEAWRAHPQAAAVALQPLVAIERIGTAPPAALPPAPRPLAGLRVLDLTRVLAGPSATRCLAEHGAEVLKVTAPHLPDSGALELDTGIGKRAAHLDLRDPRQAVRLRELIGTTDVFVQSYRPGALAARGLAPEALTALRPGIVCVSLNAWSESGPWTGRRGFDSIVQTVSGMIEPGTVEAAPRLMPVSAIDYVSGALMAFGAMVALARRAATGGSWLVRVSLARTGAWIADRGALAAAALAGVADDLPAARIDALCQEMRLLDGRLLRHLAPVVALSATPPFWSRPPVPLGHDAPAWPTDDAPTS